MYQDFERTVIVAARAQAAWSALLDFQRVASWLGIVGEVREIEPMRRYSAVLQDRVGPFTLRADIAVRVTVADAERRLHVDASGEDRQVASRISAKLDVTVSDDPRGSIVSSTGRYEITGRIATLGAAAIRKKGEHVLERFFVEMARSLA